MGDREQEWRNGKYLMRGDARRHLDRGGSGGAHPQESGVCEGALKSRRGAHSRGVDAEADTRDREESRYAFRSLCHLIIH